MTGKKTANLKEKRIYFDKILKIIMINSLERKIITVKTKRNENEIYNNVI